MPSNVITGPKQRPLRVVMYGVEGVGKSTFASDMPNPLFIDVEGGTSYLDVARIESSQSYQEVLTAIADLTVDSMGYKTLVIDTVDRIEQMLWADLCRRNNWDNIESPGFGKGFTIAAQEFTGFIARLEKLQRSTGMNVLMLAHASIRNFQDPTAPSYDRFEMKLHKLVAGSAKEWADFVFFADFERLTAKEKGKQTVKAVNSERRLIYTQRHAAYDAKSRVELPNPMDLDAELFIRLLEERVGHSKAMVEDALAMVTRIPEENRAAAIQYIETHKNNPEKILAIVKRMNHMAIVSSNNQKEVVNAAPAS